MYYCLNRRETDPYFNLAAEEYALKEFEDNVFMVWRNDPSVIIGKHQNAAREINHAFVSSQKIPVIRRITGGGTVYHDQGNINYSFITGGESGKQIDFRKFTAPVIDFLGTMGIKATFEGKNNLFAGGHKISGNAAHVYRNRALHHGTLLFETNLETLEKSILSNENLYDDKSVKSIRNRVVNIASLIDEKVSAGDFSKRLFDFMVNYLGDTRIYEWSARDRDKINEIKHERYLSWEWNFGYSPRYIIKSSWLHNRKKYSLAITVSQGIILTFKVFCDGNKEVGLALDRLGNALKGVKHDKEVVGDHIRELAKLPDIDPDFLKSIENQIF